jgi:RNA-splicing ligase RtcB
MSASTTEAPARIDQVEGGPVLIVECAPECVVLLDEIPAAYKNIDEVMEHARDLVEVKYVLKQSVNVKGDSGCRRPS